jgi:hypothetical protein
MTEDGMRRFGRLVRKVVRDHVRDAGVPPKLTLWASAGPNPRKCAAYRIGAARDEATVRQHAVSGLHEAQSRWCAIGRMQTILGVGEDGGPTREATNLFGLIVLGAGEQPALWEVEIVNGHVGAWREWVPLADEPHGEQVGHNLARQAWIDQFRFAQAALERIARAQGELEGGRSR